MRLHVKGIFYFDNFIHKLKLLEHFIFSICVRMENSLEISGQSAFSDEITCFNCI